MNGTYTETSIEVSLYRGLHCREVQQRSVLNEAALKGVYIRKFIEGSLHGEVDCREPTEASPLEDISIGKGSGKRRNGVEQDLAQK